MCAWWATKTSRSIAGAARISGTSWISSTTSRNAKTIRLEQNYRSTKNILAAAGAVVENNKARKGKKLWTEADAGDLIGLYAGLRLRKRGAVHRRRDREIPGGQPGRSRGDSVPHQLAIAPDRRGAAALRAQVQRGGRFQFLPAGGNQGHGGVPEAGGVEFGFGEPDARDQHAGARHRAHHGGADRALRRGTTG